MIALPGVYIVLWNRTRRSQRQMLSRSNLSVLFRSFGTILWPSLICVSELTNLMPCAISSLSLLRFKMAIDATGIGIWRH